MADDANPCEARLRPKRTAVFGRTHLDIPQCRAPAEWECWNDGEAPHYYCAEHIGKKRGLYQHCDRIGSGDEDDALL